MDRIILAVFIFTLSGLSLITCSSAVSIMYNSHYVNYNYFNTFNFKNSKNNGDKSSIGYTDNIITKKLKRIRLEQTLNYKTQNFYDLKDKSLDTTGVIAKKIKRNRFDNSLNFDDLQYSLSSDKSTMSYVQQFFDNTVLSQQQNDIIKSLYTLSIFSKQIEDNGNLHVIQITSSKNLNLITTDLLQLVHEIENDQYLPLVCLAPLSIYILVRSKSEKINLNSKHFLSFFFIVILISSSAVTPFSTYGNYKWMAFGEPNSLGNNNGSSSSPLNHTSISFQFSNATNNILSNHTSIPSQLPNFTTITHEHLNPVISFQFSNATNNILSNHTSIPSQLPNFTTITHEHLNPVISFQFSNATNNILSNHTSSNIMTFPIPTTSWNFTSSVLKTLSVGKTRIDNSTNTTSLNLNGNGYLKQNIISTKNLSALTLSAWVKPDYSQGSSQFTVISKENTFILAINNNIVPSKKAIFSIFDGIKWNTVTSNSTIPEDWTNLVATYDNSSISIYVNGLQESKIPLVGVPTISITGKIENQTGIISSSNSDVVIGAYLNSLRSNSNNLFSGSIQDVILYNSSLNKSQINKIYLQNVSLFNPSYLASTSTVSSPLITSLQLNHTEIEINKPVTWTQNITLSQTTNLAIQIPSDAKILDVNSASTNSTTDVSKLQILNQTSNVNTTLVSNKIVPIASLNPQMIESNKTSKLLILNDTAEQYHLKFQTSAPYTLETNKSSSDQFDKQIRVLNNSILHYTNVKSYTSLPIDLVKKGVHFKLFWMINGTNTDVTSDPRFHVQFVDTDGDGIVDRMQWIVPHLSEQDFQVEEDDGNDNGNNDNNNNCNDNGNNDNNNNCNDNGNNDNNNNCNDNGNNDGSHDHGNHYGHNNDNQDCNNQQFSIQLSENLGLSDAISTPSTRNILLQENLGLSDAISTPSTRNILLQENLGLSDAISTLHLAANQQLVNTQKEIVINSTKTDLVITSPNVNLTNIIISSTVVAPTLNYSSIVQTNSTSSIVSITNGLTILQNATNTAPTIQVILPPALTITGNSSWNGVFNLPHVISAPSIPAQANTVNTVTDSIEIGSDTVSLTFNKAVRLVFTGQAGQRVGYFSSTVPFTEIATTCKDDTQTTNNNLPSDGSCKTSVGSDLVVWTKHFTGFATWSSSTLSSTSTQGSVSTGTGGGGTGIGYDVNTSNTQTSNGLGAGPYIKIQKVSYDVCDKQTLKIQVATDAQNIPIVIIRTSLTGTIDARLAQEQPYAQENANATMRKFVYESLIPQQEKSIEIVAVETIEHNVFSVGKTIEISGCQEDLDFTNSGLTEYSSSPVDLGMPTIFDVKYQLGNGPKVLADGQSQYADNKPITVYSIIDSKAPITHTYLRFIKIGQNESRYDQVDMNASSLLISNSTYLVSGTIPVDIISAPAIKYWIHVQSQDKQVDSTQYFLAIKPQYPVNGKSDLYVTSDRAEGTVATPTVFLTNNSTGPIYGTVTLIVDGNPVYTSPIHIFNTGLTKVNLQWNTHSTGMMLSHNVYAQATFYDKKISSSESTINTFPSVQTVPISNTINIQSMLDHKGNVIATPDNLYSSHQHETGLSYRVTAPDGTCVIGNSCLVNKSTYNLENQVMKVTVRDQIYNVRYSGPESPLERFNISSVDPILGHWSVDLESNGNLIPQAQAMEKIPLKIQYHAIDTLGLQ